MSDSLRVYVSSTYSDLREYRRAAIEIIVRAGLMAVTLEEFGSADAPPLAASLDAIDSSDIIVVLVAQRIGVIVSPMGESLLELEYERARAAGKPIFCFLLDESQPWPRKSVDDDVTQIERFREKVRSEQRVSYFTTPLDLATRLVVALSPFSRYIKSPLPPSSEPERTDAPSHGTPRSNPLLSELRELRAEFTAMQQVLLDAFRQQSYERQNDNDATISSAAFLGARAPTDPNVCFVIMPYSQDWSSAVERIILEVCSAVGLEFEIARNMPGRFVPNDVWRGITRAGLVVADLSGANANVAYEIGLADVLGKDVVLIGQSTEVPFDFRAQRLILYENTLPGAISLREELEARFRRHKRAARTQRAGDA